MTREDIKKVLELHSLWINNEVDGVRANLRGADLRDANLRDVKLSMAKGLISIVNYMNANFEKTKEGYIVYKTFGGQYNPNPAWKIEQGSILEEVVNANRTDVCGCGINVAPVEWVRRNYKGDCWKCLIRWEWAAGIVVPYNTDGKIRCEKLELVEISEVLDDWITSQFC